jgi:hypothetical protein
VAILEGFKVLSEVQEERRRQDEKWGAAHDGGHSFGRWIDLIDIQLTNAVGLPNEQFRRHMVKVAAIAVAAVESYDRNGKRQ